MRHVGTIALATGLLALPAAEPPAQWPKVKPGVWLVTGHQTPAWEARDWKGQVRACDQTQSLFMGKLEGEVISLNPEERCAYTSVMLSGTSYEITAKCPVQGTVGLIRTRVVLQSEREFRLTAEKTWPKAGDNPEVHFRLEEHGQWAGPCKAEK